MQLDKTVFTLNTAASVSAASAMFNLRHFMGQQQKTAVVQGLKGEESQFFSDKLIELEKMVLALPVTYGTDGQGDEAIAYLHYFLNGMDWYITERDVMEQQLQAFGLACVFEK